MKQETSSPSWVLGTHFSRAVYYRSDPHIEASCFDIPWKPFSPSAGKSFVKPKQLDKGLVFIESAPSLDAFYQAALTQSQTIKHGDSAEAHDLSFSFPPVLLDTSRACGSPLATEDTSDQFSITNRADEHKDVSRISEQNSHGFSTAVEHPLLSVALPKRSHSAPKFRKQQQEGSQICTSKASSLGRSFSKFSLKGSPRCSPSGSPKDSPCSSQANSPRCINKSSADSFNENSSISSSPRYQGSKGSKARRDITRALSWSDHLSNGSGNERAVLSAENWMIDLSQLFLGERFASGTNSRIYHGKYGDTHVAVKVIRQPDEDELLAERLEKSFMQEMTILSCLQHHNVIKFIAACKKPPVLCVITEYLPNGSIRSFLHKREGQPLPISQVLQMALDVAYGMEYIHMKGVVHRDLKSENLVLGEDNSVKILDFGVACFESECNAFADDLGTYRWMAPEMLSKKPYTRKVDVYSFGIVLWELITGHLPYEDMGAVQAAFCVVHKVPNVTSFCIGGTAYSARCGWGERSAAFPIRGRQSPALNCTEPGTRLPPPQKNARPPIPPDCPVLLKDLMCCCWSTEPEERPEFWEILRLLNMCMQSISNCEEVNQI